MNLNIRLIILLIACTLLSSCETYKHASYFEDLPPVVFLNQDIQNNSPVLIQPNDIIELKVSSISPTTNVFDPALTKITINTTDTQPKEGFLVNQAGEIQVPLIGEVKVGGLSTTEAKDLITKRLKSYLKDPVVNVRIVNFNISVFGEVGRPGIYPVSNERVTVLEALILAGDLTKNAIKNNILLIREVEGKRQFIRLDIQSKTIFNSPFFYLKNNDLLYVQSQGKKEKRDWVLTNVNIATAVVTFALLLIKFK